MVSKHNRLLLAGGYVFVTFFVYTIFHKLSPGVADKCGLGQGKNVRKGEKINKFKEMILCQGTTH